MSKMETDMKCTNNVSLSTFDYLHSISFSEGSTILEFCCSQLYLDYVMLQIPVLLLWQLSHLVNNDKQNKKKDEKGIIHKRYYGKTISKIRHSKKKNQSHL